MAFGHFHRRRGDQLQDGDVSGACGFVVPGLVAHEDFQQLVHGVRPALLCHQPAGAAKAGVEIAFVGGDLGIKSGSSVRPKRASSYKIKSIEPVLQRTQAAHAGRLWLHGGEGQARFFHVAQLQQQLDVVKARVLVRRVGGYGVL